MVRGKGAARSSKSCVSVLLAMDELLSSEPMASRKRMEIHRHGAFDSFHPTVPENHN